MDDGDVDANNADDDGDNDCEDHWSQYAALNSRLGGLNSTQLMKMLISDVGDDYYDEDGDHMMTSNTVMRMINIIFHHHDGKEAR